MFSICFRKKWEYKRHVCTCQRYLTLSRNTAQGQDSQVQSALLNPSLTLHKDTTAGTAQPLPSEADWQKHTNVSTKNVRSGCAGEEPRILSAVRPVLCCLETLTTGLPLMNPRSMWTERLIFDSALHRGLVGRPGTINSGAAVDG